MKLINTFVLILLVKLSFAQLINPQTNYGKETRITNRGVIQYNAKSATNNWDIAMNDTQAQIDLFTPDSTKISYFKLYDGSIVKGRFKTFLTKGVMKALHGEMVGYVVTLENDEIRPIPIEEIDQAYLASVINYIGRKINNPYKDEDDENQYFLNLKTYTNDDGKTNCFYLMNPTYCSKIKIFISYSQTLAGMGNPNYGKLVIKNEKVYKLNKKNYDEVFAEFFSGCNKVITGRRYIRDQFHVATEMYDKGECD